MKKLFIPLFAIVLLSACNKEYCTTCFIKTNAPNSSVSKSYCGTSREITKEHVRLRNAAKDMKKEFTAYEFEGGCDQNY